MESFSTTNVLLIESDPKEMELYSELIREVADCKVDLMSRIDGSYDWIARSSYNLIVVDLSFQKSKNTAVKIDGLSLVERIKRTSPATAVILISESATVEEAVAAIRLGADDYLKKPFNPENFKLAIKRGLDRKMIFSQESGVSSLFNLLNSCQMISASLEMDQIFRIVQSYFFRELQSHYSEIYSYKEGTPTRMTESSPENHKDQAMEEVLDIAIHASNAFAMLDESQSHHRFIERGQLTPALFIFRFQCAGPDFFYCVCLSPKRPDSMDEFENRLRMLSKQIEMTGKTIEQYKGVQHLVNIDEVTGLYNTRYMSTILDREIAQVESNGKSFAVLFIDADKFKDVNDTHGHLVGSKLLNALGWHLKKYVREKDTVFRYGGDEFVAVLSPCDLATAKAVAERIRQSVAQTAFLESEGLALKFTVSIGVALYPDHAQSKKAVIEAADHAMYVAKKTSRNTVYVITPEFIAENNKKKKQNKTPA